MKTMVLSDNEANKFMNAARCGNLDTIKKLLKRERKISLEKHSEYGYTALTLASQKGRLNVVQYLIESNDDSVNVNGKTIDGYTALHWASYKGHVYLIEYLINKGAKVDEQNVFGRTPLHMASSGGHLSAVEFLLEMGANPLVQDNTNRTALDWAQNGGHHAIVRLIQRPQQIEEIIRCHDRLPIAVWPNVMARLKSVAFIFALVCEIPHLFQQEGDKMPKLSVLDGRVKSEETTSQLGKDGEEIQARNTIENQRNQTQLLQPEWVSLLKILQILWPKSRHKTE